MHFIALFLLFFAGSANAAGKAPVARIPPTHRVPHAARAADQDDDDEDSDDDDDDGDKRSVRAPVGPGVAPQAPLATADDENDEEDNDDEDDDTPDPHEILGNVSLVSDYVLRGLTQTEHNPAIQGGFDWIHPLGPFAGVWASSVRLPETDAELEAAFYAGYRYPVTDELGISLSVSYLSYFPSDGLNSWDFPLRLEWKGWEAGIDFSPGWQGDGDSYYVNAGWSDEVLHGFTLGVFGGYSFFASGDSSGLDYADFRVAVGHELLGLNVELSGIFVTHREIEDATVGPRAVVSVSKSF